MKILYLQIPILSYSAMVRDIQQFNKLQELINWHKKFIEEGYNGCYNNTQLESPGDLEELQYLYINQYQYIIHNNLESPTFPNGSDFEKLMRVNESLLGMWGMIHHDEMETLGGIFEEIRTKYPNMWKTIQVWVHG